MEISFTYLFIIFAHISESKYIELRDYEDEPFVIEKSSKEALEKSKHSVYGINSNYRPKKKQAVIHYGRHIYHLDSFDDLTKLRSKISKLKPDYVSFDYFDVHRSKHAAKSKPWDYVQDLIVLSSEPKKCKGDNCYDLRKYNSDFNKIKRKKIHVDSDEEKWAKGQMTPSGHLKRFKIVHNRKKHKKRKQEKSHSKKSKPKKSHKKKKTQSHSSAKRSDESKSRESTRSGEDENSRERKDSKVNSQERKTSNENSQVSNESNEDSQSKESTSIAIEDSKASKKYEGSSSESQSGEEISSNEYNNKKKTKEKHYSSESKSYETRKNSYESQSSVERPKKNKKLRKKYDTDIRKTLKVVKDVVLQGHNIYDSNDFQDNDYSDSDSRRRLPHFMPKRYHWEPSEIHDLGYYWFNGPRGMYPHPKPIRPG